LIANGQDIAMFGDNLFLDLDLSKDNLPVGSRLRAGTAVLEVTPKPHDGCVKFKERFGSDALQFVVGKQTRQHNLRGIYLKVVGDGEVRVGDTVEVLRRPSGAGE
jgi:MOSC domain-containing protein YiiM